MQDKQINALEAYTHLLFPNLGDHKAAKMTEKHENKEQVINQITGDSNSNN